MKALGLIETKGMVGAIVAADAALKTAQVELINREHTKGGMVCIEFEGDVAAVKASVEAGVAAVKEMGVLIGSHVIPRPDDSVELVKYLPWAQVMILESWGQALHQESLLLPLLPA